MTYQLIHGDCLEVLPGLQAGSVDAIICDPPYGIGFKYATHDDTPIGYGEWLWSVLELCESKLKPGSPVFVFQAMPNIRNFSEWFPREWRIYAAAKNFVQMRPVAMQYSFDPVVCWWTEGKPYSAQTRSRDFFVANTSPAMHIGLNNVNGHPCPRPLDQMRVMVDQWVRPGGTVLDPFAGSGSTVVAAILEKRNAIGIELDSGYIRIAQRRCADAAAQPRLLDIEPAPLATQATLI